MKKKTLRLPAYAAGLAALLVAAAPGACSNTPNPEEVYAQPRANGGSSRGGSSRGGAAGEGAARNEPGSGGELTTAGAAGEADEGGAAGQDGGEEPVVVECGSAPVSDESFSKAALRRAAAACADWQYCRFENAATVLASRVAEHADTRSETSLSRARDAYREAMELWSMVELFQFGPLASAAESAGKDIYQGQGMRELIYSWRLVARCRVEEQVASQAFASGGMDGVLISGRGLYALEYLLFYPGTDSECLAATPTGQAWPGFDAEELEARKLGYAVAVADDVLQRTQTLRTTWAPSGGNFRETFVSASDPSKYPSEQEAMNALGWALIYIEKEVKDWKLGMRIGTIPGDHVPEVPFAAATAGFEALPTENIRRNLRGFRALFQGCGDGGEGLGFDDWLSEAGHGELATDIVAAWQGAQSAADAFPPLETASTAELDALYQSLRTLTNLLKTEMFGAGSPLGLKLPTSVGSDTD